MSALQYCMDMSEDRALFSYYGTDFGLEVDPHHIHRSQRPGFFSLPSMFSRRSKSNKDSTVSNVGKDGFQVCMDVQQFKPNELSVKVVGKAVVVEGKQEEREDEHGSISRHFVRRYKVPKNYDADKVISTLSSDGVLTLCIPKPAIDDKLNEKVIHIQQTGPAHMNVRENTQEKPDQAGTAGDKSSNGSKK